MKISTTTRDVLKNFSQINNSIYFNESNAIKVSSPGEDVYAIYKCEETFPEHAIYDLNEFLALSSLSSNPDFDYEDKYVAIKCNNNTTRYYYTDPENVLNHTKDYNAYTKVFDADFNASFVLTHSDIQTFVKTARLLKADEIMVISIKDGKGTIEAEPLDKTDAINTVSSTIDGEGTADVKLKLKSINPIKGDYRVSINDKFVLLKHEELDLFYIVAPAIGV